MRTNVVEKKRSTNVYLNLFQTDEDFWINLQAAHDRWESRNIIAENHFKPIQSLLTAAG